MAKMGQLGQRRVTRGVENLQVYRTIPQLKSVHAFLSRRGGEVLGWHWPARERTVQLCNLFQSQKRSVLEHKWYFCQKRVGASLKIWSFQERRLLSWSGTCLLVSSSSSLLSSSSCSSGFNLTVRQRRKSKNFSDAHLQSFAIFAQLCKISVCKLA